MWLTRWMEKSWIHGFIPVDTQELKGQYVVGIVALLISLGGLGSLANAQMVFNPTKIQFASPDHNNVETYTLMIWTSTMNPDVENPLASFQIPVNLVSSSGNVDTPFQANFVDFSPPVLMPAGSTYIAKLQASNTVGSNLSPLSPNTFRWTSCAVDNGTDVQISTVTVAPFSSVARTDHLGLVITVTAPHPVREVVADIIGDGLPAWYFTPEDARTKPVTLYIGPFRRIGTFILDIAITDTYGCSATIGASTMITVH